LGDRRSSVFPAPPRPLLEAASWQQACRIRNSLEGKKISQQTWAIVSKIREIDEALRRELARAAWVREVHPEVSFGAWRGSPMAHAKKKPAGRSERLALVSRHFGDSAFLEVRRRHLKRDVADDDILDAFAALWTAERILRGESSRLPEIPSHDRLGLPMQILY
ncbi:MAG: DUF429 domain-containing protein, partial [Myxococcota bacterium]